MLYERWRRVAREFEDEIALRDLGTGESWTFGQLAKITENQCGIPAYSPIFVDKIIWLGSIFSNTRFSKLSAAP